MRYTTFTVAAALLGSASAHTRIYGAYINGEFQGDGRSKYIRSPPNNDPVTDLTSPDLACNAAGGTPAPSFVAANAGDEITLEWYHNNPADDILDSTHKGPVSTYIAEYFTDDGAAPIWTKIAEAGYDGAAGTWAVDDLIAAKGKWTFTMPESLASGQYMIRQEIIGLHEADTCNAEAGSRGAQVYPSCVQFEVTGTGSATPGSGYDFNEGYSCDEPGIFFNLYGDFDSYTVPGPAVDSGLSGAGSGSSDGGEEEGEEEESSPTSPGGATPTGSGSSSGSSAPPASSGYPTKGAGYSDSGSSGSSNSTDDYDTYESSDSSGSSGSGSGSSCSKRRKARKAREARAARLAGRS